MTFNDVLTQVLELLQREKRVSYRALKRRFDLDDEYLEDLKDEIIKAKRLAMDEEGSVLVWAGNPQETVSQPARTTQQLAAQAKSPPQGESCTRSPAFTRSGTPSTHRHVLRPGRFHQTLLPT